MALEPYAWQGASLVAAALVSDARVPDLSPANVLVLEEVPQHGGLTEATDRTAPNTCARYSGSSHAGAPWPSAV